MSIVTSAAHIDELRTFVTGALPVTRLQYPSITDGTDMVAFCVKHSALHFSKTSGQLAALAEAFDHGLHPDISEATKIVANSIVNALKLADELSISTNDIISFLHDKYRSG